MVGYILRWSNCQQTVTHPSINRTYCTAYTAVLVVQWLGVRLVIERSLV